MPKVNMPNLFQHGFDWRWDVRLDLDMPLPHFMVLDTLASGEGISKDDLVGMTLAWSNRYSHEGADPKWCLKHDEVSQAIDDLESRKYLFRCTPEDQNFVNEFHYRSGVGFVVNAMALGLYYLTFLGASVALFVRRRCFAGKCYHHFSKNVDNPSEAPFREMTDSCVWFIWEPENIRRGQVDCETLGALARLFVDDKSVRRLEGSQIMQIGPWAGAWWDIKPLGFTCPVEQLINDADDAEGE